jgi:membrane protein
MSLRAIPGLLKETGFAWLEDRGPRLGAALAFYTLFSLAPLLIIVIAVAALAFGQEVAHAQPGVGQQTQPRVQGVAARRR